MTSNNQEPTPHQGNTKIEAVDTKELEHQISEAEQNERKKAVAFAYASIGLSGFDTSAEMKHLGQRYITGEINLNQFVMLSQKLLPDTSDSQPSGTQ
ncbi:antitoxin VbhA family protein [Pseudomonas fildesensis]|uniref:antitoxin VbhA family protein n=1 Tax=Pseudomonas fildesensis TaxID=1674920 RepID=UPI00387B9D0A